MRKPLSIASLALLPGIWLALLPAVADDNGYGRPGSDDLRGMGNLKGSLLGVLTVGSRIIGETAASATLALPISKH
ncbi:outer membrane protein V [Ralstonia pseudosolanacearum]|uniref:Outer membrane protein V n=1 Tax=Ralstonia solanacearum TaxID=305 RepID=A0A0S4WQA9_RALSL|nr:MULTISPECIES: outer membrane protein V [Ralstonia]AGH84603.1 Outer membrane protein V [Ralstonia pseudosolanacearum FQY_4]UZF16236.1 hypothetical protein LH706_07295 [Ralstonia solanacearum]UZF31263.1 hypothetical protein LGV82_06695 [Ralstonia sp. RS650]CUV53783.1 Outer membrane protein V [Ralstonia solanacearum]